MQTRLRRGKCYCIGLRRAANTLTRYYDNGFAGLQITTSQFSLLVNIGDLGACNKSALARRMRLDRTTIIRNLEALARKGLIEEADEDGGAGAVRLTGAGQRAVEEGLVAWERMQAQVKEAIGEEDIAALERILRSIARLEPPPA